MQIPAGDQWEKAARGSDGRFYPWGNHYFRSFLNTQETFGTNPSMLQLKNLPGNASIYGVHGLAGNFIDWNIDQDPMNLGHSNLRGLRGGFWSVPEVISRSAYRDTFAEFDPMISTSFRLIDSPTDRSALSRNEIPA